MTRQLLSDSKTVRDKAVAALNEKNPTDVLFCIISLLQEEISSYAHSTCLDIAERYGAHTHIEQFRQDGWLESTYKDLPNIKLVTHILGKRYLAYAVLLGIQIQQIRNDTANGNDTEIHFTTDDGIVHVLPLNQFKSHVTSLLLNIGIQCEDNCTWPLTELQAIKIIGELPLLIAPLFNISIRRVIAVNNPMSFRAVVGMITDIGYTYMEIKEFHAMILELLKRDLQEVSSDELVLDLSTDAAEQEYANQNYEGVIQILSPWSGLLSTMLKTPAIEKLSEDDLKQIASGLLMLSESYSKTGKKTFARDLLRLALQYVKDTSHQGPLYLNLGILLNELEQYGQAIGYLKRAITLGIDPKTTYLELTKALFHRKKYFCAYLIAEKAKKLNNEDVKRIEAITHIQKELQKLQFNWPW